MSDISFQSVKHFELGPSVPHAHEPSALPVGGGGGVAVDVVGAILQRLRDRGLQDDEEEREDEGGEEGRAGRLLRDGRRYAGEQLHSAWDETKKGIQSEDGWVSEYCTLTYGIYTVPPVGSGRH